MHNHFCDGKGSLEDYVDKAKELNVRTLGFSSHAPLPFDCSWCMDAEKFDDYLHQIQSLKAKHRDIEIYTGLEVDYIPGIISPQNFRDVLDYTVGSIHFTETLPDGRRWEIDGTHSLFLEGLENLFKNDIRSAIQRYYELTREMITTTPPDILGHLDKIKIQNIGDKFFREDDTWYRQEIIKSLDVIASSRVIVEVNTRGIYQKKSSTTYPSPWILQEMHQRKIPITLNSDAHHPDDLINQFAESARMLNQIGYREMMRLKDGKWQATAFDEGGFILV